MARADDLADNRPANDFDPRRTATVERAKPTVSHVLGEMVWLLSQSPTHKHFKIADLEWLIMPPILLRQYRVFYGQKQPVGFALWAYFSAETEERFAAGATRLRPEEWALDGVPEGSGPADAGPRDGKLWLVDLVAPFATSENRMVEAMMVDLADGPFKDRTFWFHRTDPKSGRRSAVQYGKSKHNA
jgi:cytolysin-activating lysine-acyltransferase